MNEKQARQFLKKIVKVAYPEYRGRKIYSKIQDSALDVRSCWDEGARTYFTFVNLKNMKTLPVPAQSAYDRALGSADAVIIPRDCVCVTHRYFMGHDCGVTIIFSNENLFAEQGAAQLLVS